MTLQDLIHKLEEQFGDGIKKVTLRGVEQGQEQLQILIDKSNLKTVADYVFNQLSGRLVTIVGADRRPATGQYEVTYVFALNADSLILLIKIEVSPDDLKVDSITPIISGAGWFERELKDLLGIEAVGNPDLRRLILADDWPEDLHPLRSDFPFDYKPPKVPNARPDVKPAPGNSTVINVGPFFPTLEEPAYFRLFVEGERIVGSDYRGFYSHRGIEKLANSALDYNQVPFLAERICGICGFVHSCGYCQAVETAAEIEVPVRAKYIRTFMLELERVHSHLLWLGLAAHIIGFDTVLMQSWRIREPVMWMAEQISGNRKTYGMNLVGGVRRDISPELHPKILEVLDKVESESKSVVDALVGDTILKMRLEKVGVLNYEKARAYCVVGPTARGSGVKIDVRHDFPYAVYDKMKIDIPSYPEGDVWARTLVRAQELFESINLMRQTLKEMPEGPIMAENVVIPPGREGVALLEAPRGECCHYVLTGENAPERWAVRAPTYVQLAAIPEMFPNQTVADAPIIVGSIDPCFSCTERVETVDVRTKNIKVYTGEELRKGFLSGKQGGEKND